MANDPVNEDFIDVYRTDSTFAAQKIIDTLLAPEGIETLLSDRHVAMVPSPGQEGVHLSVAAHDRDRALAILREAQENGFLGEDEGELLS